MQVVAVTDPMQLGFDRQAMIGIKSNGDTRETGASGASLDLPRCGAVFGRDMAGTGVAPHVYDM